MSPDSSHSSILTNGVSSVATSLTAPNASPGSVAGKKPADGGGGGGGGGGAPPRVDLEPIYEGLQAGLAPDQWSKYKEGLSGFILGRINRQELSNVMDNIITGPKQRLHNQLLIGIYTNASSRDTPPHEIAPYVLATNRASTTHSRGLRGNLSNPTDSGDARVEARLKTEVMSLAARDRRRIKEVPESNPEEIPPSLLYSYHQAKQIKIPDPDVPPQSATPNALNNKTNWEAEIKSRYALPLACESGEFPDLEGIKMRMLPICYEEGVVGGVGEATAQFMNVAAEIFVKEILSAVISRVRCNRTNTVKTDSYKRKLEKMMEDQSAPGGFGFGGTSGGGSGITLSLNGSINKSSSSNRGNKRQKLLNGRPNFLQKKGGQQVRPQQELAGEKKVLCMNDLRLSFTLGDNFLTKLPLSLNRIMTGGYERPEDYYSSAEYNGMPPPPPPQISIQGVSGPREGRNQPNFAKRGGNVSGLSADKHNGMLDALVGPAGGPGILSPQLQHQKLPTSPIPAPAKLDPLPNIPNQTALADDLLWNDGFEPWGPDFNTISLGGIGAPGQEFYPNSVDVNEIINGWEFHLPPPPLPPGASGEWFGAGAEERRELRGLLDDCLAVGM